MRFPNENVKTPVTLWSKINKSPAHGESETGVVLTSMEKAWAAAALVPAAQISPLSLDFLTSM